MAKPTSDVRRFAGIGVACVVSLGSVLCLLAYREGLDGMLSPGALSPAHREAGVQCADCHASHSAAPKCGSCHGGQASVRTAHEALRQSGSLQCADCHAIHGEARGIRFESNGSVAYYLGAELEPLHRSSAFVPERTVHVPLVAASACQRCHGLDQASDVAAHCFTRGLPSGSSDGSSDLNPDAPVLCFDEHRLPGERSPGTNKSRDAAWAAARRAAHSSAAPRSPTWLILATALSLGGLLALAFRRHAQRSRPETEAPRPSPATRGRTRLPQIDETTCLGCQACVDACPYDVLEMRRFVAVLARPDDCCGLSLCEQRCPNGSLEVRELGHSRSGVRVSAELESLDVPGLYVAGDLSGVPLIRNAIAQGARVVNTLVERLKAYPEAEPHVFDVLIVGSGPAGLSASLEAKRLGLRALTLEQASIADSIRSFPRQKLVFDQGEPGPRHGLWLEECEKEVLLGKWLRLVRRERLEIVENTRVTRVQGEAGAFVVHALNADGTSRALPARSVLLAVGKRGTPRKLSVPIPEGAASMVHYWLSDARTFAKKSIVIVGLGDAAMEAAIALCHQPETRVVICYRGTGFRRGKSRNIAELERLRARGRLTLLFQSEIEAIRAGAVSVRTRTSASTKIECEALFVMIGSLPPWAFLSACGVQRDRPVVEGGADGSVSTSGPSMSG